jgi:hypothetical protein
MNPIGKKMQLKAGCIIRGQTSYAGKLSFL